MARSFSDRQMVRCIKGGIKDFKVGDICEVRRGLPDSDGEIQVWQANQRDWQYMLPSFFEAIVEENTTPVAPVAPTQTNQEGNTTMATINRRVVRVHLIDEDAGLDVSKSLVKDFGTHVLEGTEQELIQELLMDPDVNVASALRAHNAVRAKEIDLDIRQRTGNEVKLNEVKLKELSWKVTAA